jgi:hypothetical protein
MEGLNHYFRLLPIKHQTFGLYNPFMTTMKETDCHPGKQFSKKDGKKL